MKQVLLKELFSNLSTACGNLLRAWPRGQCRSNCPTVLPEQRQAYSQPNDVNTHLQQVDTDLNRTETTNHHYQASLGALAREGVKGGGGDAGGGGGGEGGKILERTSDAGQVVINVLRHLHTALCFLLFFATKFDQCNIKHYFKNASGKTLLWLQQPKSLHPPPPPHLPTPNPSPHPPPTLSLILLYFFCHYCSQLYLLDRKATLYAGNAGGGGGG